MGMFSVMVQLSPFCFVCYFFLKYIFQVPIPVSTLSTVCDWWDVITKKVFHCGVGLEILDTLDVAQSKMFSPLIRHHLFRHFYCVMVDWGRST